MIINLIPILGTCLPEVQGLREGGHSPGSIQEGKRLLQAARRSMPCENRPRGKKTPKRVTANKGKEMTPRNHTHDVVRIKGRELWFNVLN